MRADEVRAVMGHFVWGFVDRSKDFGFDYKEVKSY
jgi:hypothetical protein